MGQFLYATNGSTGLGWARPLSTIDVVKEYGAKFDGTTDDTLALTNALAAAGSQGPIVQLPAGAAKLSSLATHGTLTVPDGVILQGHGPGATVLNGTNLSGFTGTVLTVKGGGSVVRDFCLQYDSSGVTHANDGILVQDDFPAWGSFYGGGTFATLENLLVWNIAGNAITLDGIEIRCINCYVCAHALSTGDGGFGFYVPNTDCMLIGCTADHCGNNGYAIDGGNTKLVGCKAFGNGFGASASAGGHGFGLSGSRHMLSGCESQDNYGSGFMCIAGAENNQFAGCLADTNGQGGTNVAGFNLIGASSVAGCGATNRSGASQKYGFYGRADGDGTLPIASGCWSTSAGTANVGGSWAYAQVNMPTADPHVVGQAWANSHVVTVSAG